MYILIEDNNTLIRKDLENDFSYKGIIFKKDNDFKISCKEELTFVENKAGILKEGKYSFDSKKEIINVYVYTREYVKDYEIYENKNSLFLSDTYGDVILEDANLKNAEIRIADAYIECDKCPVFVNDKRYFYNRLKNGDHIKILSFDFYYFDNFLYINANNAEIALNKASLKDKTVRFKSTLPRLYNYYSINIKEPKIEKLQEFKEPSKNNRSLLLQIGPSISMSLTMVFIAIINIYNSYLNNGYSISMISMALMPLSVVLSGFLWPLITRLLEDKKYKKEYDKARNNYLTYLREYEEKNRKEINRYISELSFYSFDLNKVKDKLFYISAYSSKFLTLYLGEYIKNFGIDYKLTGDSEINENLSRIKSNFNNVSGVPLLLDLKKNRRISFIVSNENDNTEYLLKVFLMELASRYSYDDLKIAVYTKNQHLLNSIYSLPHLFSNKTRMFFVNERELAYLNTIRDEVVLLCTKEIDQMFKDNVKIIFFSDQDNRILKESNCIVRFNKNFGVLNAKESINFTPYYPKEDFEALFDYISLFPINSLNSEIRSFHNSPICLDILKNYKNNKTGLRAPFAYSEGEILDFDLHESKDGPHGLIGGSTGSGKSELIISLLLSLIINYSSDYLNIILIDYKGGGIKESLSYKSKTVPHIIASIDNLDDSILERLIVTIDRILKRRQNLFKKLSELSNTSIMSIDDYLEKRETYNLEKMPHLLIVVDEFAQMKKESPQIIKELISFSRIGRSLGLHLILATQKPGGVIDDEIWSNSRFKIALKVTSEKDSNDIIKKADAAYLKNPGEFYLSVDGSILKGEAIYSKTDIYNNEPYCVGEYNQKMELVSKRSIKNDVPFYENSYLVLNVLKASETLGIKTAKLEYRKPIEKSSRLLSNIYAIENCLILGEIDDYLNAAKGCLNYSLSENILIYSNRKDELNSFINTFEYYKKPMVVISEKIYRNSYVLDSVHYQDEDDLLYLFEKLLKNPKDDIRLLIENYETLISYNENYQDYLLKILRRESSSKVKVVLLTSSSAINFKILNAFKNRVAIEINDSSDLINIFSSKGNYKGKSYFLIDTPITFVPCKIENLNESNSIFKSYLDKVEENLCYEYFDGNVLIGADLKRRKKIYLKYNESLLISGFDEDELAFYKRIFLRHKNIEVSVFNNGLLGRYNNILWIGEGLMNQKLFYPEKYMELNEKESYLYKAGKGYIVKAINHE